MSLTFAHLAALYEKLEHTTSGNSIRTLIASFLKTTQKQELSSIVHLTRGTIASDYEKINLGMADTLVLRAITLAVHKPFNHVQALAKKLGDLGLVAEKLVGGRKKKLTVREVFKRLHDIAQATGAGSQEIKTKILAQLLENASPIEARYICRIVLGTLRLGVADMTILDSLALAFTGSKTAKKKLQQAYNTCPDMGIIAETLAKQGLLGIRKIKTVIGRPIHMMLAQRIKDITELPEKIPGAITAEEKYDGERIQVHKKGNAITLYSRRLENISNQFPEIITAIKSSIKAKNCIIEGECVAIDKQGNLLPFQTLMQRKRKYDIPLYVKKVPVRLYLFDLLHLDTASFIKISYKKRRATLEKIVLENRQLQLARQITSENLDDIEEFFNQTIQHGGEGIIAKSNAPNSFYTPGKRGWLWIKWKREYSKEMADTFDFVIVGAFMGKGKRSGAYGALLCAVYNSVKDVFETVCKLGSGFTDKQLRELPPLLKKYAVATKPARVIISKTLLPDIWFEPAIVVEVTGAELTRSSIHTRAIKKGTGLSLRFPRFIRYRDDKKPEQATTVKEIEALVRNC